MQAQSNAEMLIPRKYQEEIFVQAQKGNVIAALDTGAGKTYISALLIKWMSVQQPTKSIAFLVSKRELAEQQGDFLCKHTSLRIAKIHGALDLGLSDRDGWIARLKQYDVFVMTAQNLVNLLTHALWTIDKFSLLVFDECHHTHKNHPFNSIMKEYFETSFSLRPKVFGMTASPVWDARNALRSLQSLEHNMDAQIIGVQEHAAELEEFLPKPMEKIELYLPPPKSYSYHLGLFQALEIFTDHYKGLSISWSNIQRRYLSTLNNLGPYCAELYLYTEMKACLSQFLNTYESLDGISAKLHMHISQIQSILEDYAEFFSESTSFVIIPSEHCSPKVQTLISILLSHYAIHSSIDEYSDSSIKPLQQMQTIVFVEQRQVAFCLAYMLSRVFKLSGQIECAALLGQGVGAYGVSKAFSDINNGNKHNAAKLFREGKINLLIATSVAEEGLDFPACSLIIRFDPLQHLIGYLQSRGRARSKIFSTYIVMIQKGDDHQVKRYAALSQGEVEAKEAWKERRIDLPFTSAIQSERVDDDEDNIDSQDVTERERYIVPGTGAVLTYDNAVGLLNYLCALIPGDKYTLKYSPKYRILSEKVAAINVNEATTSNRYYCRLQLPACLSLPNERLVYTGPQKRSKREAKRAVAFYAVKTLQISDVFDSYLLPTSISYQLESGNLSMEENIYEITTSSHFSATQQADAVIETQVLNPWIGDKYATILWLHPVYLNKKLVAGLITGTWFKSCELKCSPCTIASIGNGQLLNVENLGNVSRDKAIKLMNDYTKLGIWHRITAKPITQSLSFYFVPVRPDQPNQIDFDSIEKAVTSPYGCYNWTGISSAHYDQLMVMNNNQYARPLLLRRIRDDLDVMSVPIAGSREENASTYYDYWVKRWTSSKRHAHVPINGPLIEVYRLPRYDSGSYHLRSVDRLNVKNIHSVSNGDVLPQGSCGWLYMTPEIQCGFKCLPQLCHYITDLYHVQHASLDLGLPAINSDLLIEAFTIPNAKAEYSNQRMETLGDSVLKLCVTVHLFNRYPYRHEGQLSSLRQQCISNQHLMTKAKEIGLEKYLITEPQSVHTWRYVDPEQQDENMGMAAGNMHRHVTRTFPRRSLQDCMEATLAAAFETGGIPMALQAGDVIGLAFGGTIPWPERYDMQPPDSVPLSAMFNELQDILGYRFRRGNLLIEAVTHPSFIADFEISGSSYQRLEFLGDALIDMVVVKYLYDKFPYATSDQIATPRTRAVCCPALSFLAVKRLHVHKVILLNSVELSMDIAKYVPIMESISGEKIVKEGWRYDPPKVMSDVFESIMGAVLVDSGYDYEKAAVVVEYAMEEVLSALSPLHKRDPVSELVLWLAKVGCGKYTFEKSRPENTRLDAATFVLHDITIAGPEISTSYTVAKCLVSEKAQEILQQSEGEKSLSSLCDCKKGKTAARKVDVEDAATETQE